MTEDYKRMWSDAAILLSGLHIELGGDGEWQGADLMAMARTACARVVARPDLLRQVLEAHDSCDQTRIIEAMDAVRDAVYPAIASASNVARQEDYGAFLDWWIEDGHYYDPDPDVDWHDKRQGLAAYVWQHARVGQPVVARHPLGAPTKLESIVPDSIPGSVPTPLSKALKTFFDKDYPLLVGMAGIPNSVRDRIPMIAQGSFMSGRDSLSFEGDGRVSVDARELVKSPRFQEQLKGVREIAASLGHSFVCAACGVSQALAHTVSCEEALAAVASEPKILEQPRIAANGDNCPSSPGCGCLSQVGPGICRRAGEVSEVARHD